MLKVVVDVEFILFTDCQPSQANPAGSSRDLLVPTVSTQRKGKNH